VLNFVLWGLHFDEIFVRIRGLRWSGNWNWHWECVYELSV